MVHGAAGSTGEGSMKHYWAPEKEGADFEMSQSLEPLAPYRDYLTIVSDTDLRSGDGACAGGRRRGPFPLQRRVF